MRRLRRLVVVLGLAAAACMPRHGPDGAAPSPDPAHASRDSLDWAGVYEGVVPCVGCSGVRTRLVLERDERYELGTQELGREAAPRIVRGRFGWLPGGNAIALERRHGAQRFLVGEGRVALLQAGAPPSWPQAEPWVLHRVAQAPADAVRRTLESHRWTLASAVGGRGEAIDGLPTGGGRAIVVGFADGRVDVEGGCNRILGSYRIDGGDRLVVSGMASTLMACEQAAMDVDATLSALLATPARVDLPQGADPVLRLVTGPGATLSFGGRLTHEARYGAPARVFLEVAAQPVACTVPGGGQGTCLQVRERRYDDQGLSVGTPGEWRALGDPIEGHTHVPGVRTVLRLKRFERDASGGESPFVYVLDLVVESEAVSRGTPR